MSDLDRLGRTMIATLPEGEVRAVVYLNDGRSGCLNIGGYPPGEHGEMEAMADIYTHLIIVFESRGGTLPRL